MTKTMRAIAVAVCVLACAPVLHAQDREFDPAVVEAAKGWQDATATRLARAGDARSLAFAATLRQVARAPMADGGMPSDDTPSTESVPDAEVARWREQALAKGGNDPQALAMLMGADRAGDTSVRTRAAIAWAQREPRNLAPLLFRGDEVDVLLADAARTDVFDMHFLDQLRVMRDATVRNGPDAATLRRLTGDDTPVEEFAVLQAAAIWAAVAMPGFRPLMDDCQGRALRDPERLAACTHVADVLVTRSDTAIGTMFGHALKVQVAPDDASRQAAEEARRTFDWQMQEWGRVSAGLPRNGGAQFASMLRDPAIADENAMRVRILTLAGVSLTPPDGWRMPRRR